MPLLLDVIQHSLSGIGVVSETYKSFLKRDDDKKGKSKSAAAFFSNLAQIRGETKKDSPNHPSRILSQSQYFKNLYQLLDADDKIAYQVWQLLNLIPKNEVSADDQSFADFSDKHLFKLVYNLQITETMIEKNIRNRDTDLAAMHKSVLTPVLPLLFSVSDVDWNIGVKKAFAHLLKVVNHLVLGRRLFKL
jgi:hypothetical protein